MRRLARRFSDRRSWYIERGPVTSLDRRDGHSWSTPPVFAAPPGRPEHCLVDRRFHRLGYEHTSVADQLTDDVRQRVDPDSIARTWMTSATTALEPQMVGIWVREHNDIAARNAFGTHEE